MANTELDQLRARLAQAQAAFAQNPTPALSTVIKSMAAKARRLEKKQPPTGPAHLVLTATRKTSHDDPDWMHMHCLPADAARHIKRLGMGRKVLLRCQQSAALANDADHVQPVYGTVETSVRLACKYVADNYGRHGAEVYVYLTWCRGLLFVG